LSLSIKRTAIEHALTKLESIGVDTQKPWLLFHPGVSEKKREYPEALWIQTIMLAREKFNTQILVSGSQKEKPVAERIQHASGTNVLSIAGLMNMEEMIAVVYRSALIVSVNTSIIHIAAAGQVPVVVLYALTNPQHTPWRSPYSMLPFSVPEQLKSRNEVIRYVDGSLFSQHIDYPSPEKVIIEMDRMFDKNRHQTEGNIFIFDDELNEKSKPGGGNPY
jgi:ADP-heptose:LPS heptosyltransferase